MLCLFSGHATAASLAKIEVASHLGEPFYAEVPVRLEAGEKVSGVLVEIASPADYKIFEVYRDPVLQELRADVTSDERGVRVKLSSSSNLKAPFFNLILKIHSGRVSHFKKFPVFLDTKKSVQQISSQKPLPSVQAVKADIYSATPLTEAAGRVVSSGTTVQRTTETASSTPHEYFSGWARTNRYGPIVRGDSLSTVARRLMVDQRYTLSQVRVALFEKNRSSFAQENMNLLKKNSFLDVPTAEEVERHSPAEASAIFLEHEKQWNQLIKQPRYAAEAEAQRTRYTKHISVGERADGVTSAPESTGTASAGKKEPPATKPTTAEASADKADTDTTLKSVEQAQDNTTQLVAQLQEQNALLQKQLADNQQNIEMLKQKINQAAEGATNARIDRLKVLISQLQTELQQARVQQPVSLFDGLNWLIWVLIGLLVILLGTIAVLLRREPTHPADSGRIPAESSEQGKEAVAATVAKEGSDQDTAEPELDKNSDKLADADARPDQPELGDVAFDGADFDMADVRKDQESSDEDLFDLQDFSESDAMNWLQDIPGDDDLSDKNRDAVTEIATDSQDTDDLLMDFELPGEEAAFDDKRDTDTVMDIAADKLSSDDQLMEFELPTESTVSTNEHDADKRDADSVMDIAADKLSSDDQLMEFELPTESAVSANEHDADKRDADSVMDIAADKLSSDDQLMEFELPTESAVSANEHDADKRDDADTVMDIAMDKLSLDDQLMEFEQSGEGTASADVIDSSVATDIADGAEKKPDDGFMEFEVPDNEMVVTDEEEPVRHLDHLLSKFDDDDLEFTVDKPERPDEPEEDGEHKKD